MDPNQPQNSFNSPPDENPMPQPAAPVAPKKSKKGLILGLAIGGGVLLIGLIVTLVLVLTGGVSKQDFSDARQITDDTTSSYNKVRAESISEDGMSGLKTARVAFDDNYKKLGETRAIKKDKEAADLYKKVSAEKSDLDTYLNTAAEFYEAINPIVKEIVSVSYTDSDTAISNLKSYQAKLEALDLKQKVNKDYINEITSILPEFIAAVDAYANMTEYDASLYQKVSDLSTKLTDADATWKSNVNDLYEAIDFANAIDDLSQYLDNRANGVK